MLQAAGRFIPARFLALIGHFVLLVTLLWSMDSNVRVCLGVGYSQEDYDQQHKNLTVGFAIAIALFGIELISFLFGISMFVSSIAMISIFTHTCAAITLSLYILEEWDCERYWYIFGFCSVLPAFFEFIAVVLFLLGKRK